MPAPTGRDNGLPVAASYIALVDVDPPVADHVLALLRDAGVPAVAEPLAGELGPYQDVRPPRRPTERVHVDRDRAADARTLVGAALPALRADFHADAALRSDRAQMRAADVEQAFAEIVSGFDAPTGSSTGDLAWPTRGARLDGDDEDAPGEGGEDEPLVPRPRRGLSARLVRHSADEDDEAPDPSYWPQEHFVPPVPPRGPRGDRASRFAWAGVIGGPLVLLLVVTLGLQVERVVLYVAIGAFVAGFATLIARLPERSDDDGDDGAVV